MDEKRLTDIAEVCEKFNVTSRTLRFYEEEGLIKSSRDEQSPRRKYSKEQIEQIREVLTLRTIGISVKEIKSYLEGNRSLKDVIQLRKAEIIATVNSRMKEIKMLNDALMAIDDGDDVMDMSKEKEKKFSTKLFKIARACADHIVKGEMEQLYHFFGKRIIEYMPVEAFAAMWRDTIEGMGDFVRMGDTTVSSEGDNIVFQTICFEKVTVRIKFVFHNNVIHGIWTDYVE